MVSAGQLSPSPPPIRKPPVKQGLAALVAVILGSVYAVEGGYVNDPKDRGGETNYGVTKRVAIDAGWKGPSMRTFPKHCSEGQPVCADSIYFKQYIEKPGFVPVVMVDPAVGEELVDSAVNMGPKWPSLWFQQSLNELAGAKVAVDGSVSVSDVSAYVFFQQQVGSKTACLAMLDRLDAKQWARYQGIVQANPSQAKFLKGWKNNRIDNVNRKKCEGPL